MPLTLAQLLQTPTQDQIYQRALGLLGGIGFQITDWLSGGPYKTLLNLDADSLFEFCAKLLPDIVAGGLIDLAPDNGWLDLLGYYFYQLPRNEATVTTRTILLTCSASAGPYTIAVGQLWFSGASGNRYTNTTGGVLASGGTLSITVQSESVNNSAAGVNYVDGPNTITHMITPLPGVTCNNPAPVFSPVTLSGTSTGVVTPSGGAPVASSWVVRIDTAGQTGVASWSYSRDGADWVSAGAVNTLANIGGSGVTITLTNGASNPSFLLGDRFSFTAPGTDVIQQGADREGADNYRSRCKARWPSLSAIPTASVYELWARTASASVTRVLVRTFTGTAAGQVDIYVAGLNGALPAPTVALIQDYITQRQPLTDLPIVRSPTNRAILIGATVYVKAAYLAAAQAQAQQLLANYITGSGVAINGLVLWAQIMELLMTPAGVTNVPRTLLTIGVGGNAPATTDGDLSTFGGQNVATFAQVLASTLTWVAV